MAIQANKPNNRIFLLLGIVLAALAFGGVLFALRQGNGATTSIVVAKTSIPAGSQITSDQVTTASYPQDLAPPDALTDPTAAVGKVVGSTVSPNTPIVPALFQSTTITQPSTASNGSAAAPVVSVESQLIKGFVAIAIPAAGELPQGFTQLQQNNVTGELTSDAFYIQPGDHIDILVLVINGNTFGTRFAFQDLPVLRVGVNGSAANAAATSYTVEVARNQVELLTALITGQGHQTVLKYVLRPQTEWGKLTPTGYTPNYLPSSGGSTPAVPDSLVTAANLDSLFGH